MNMESIRRRSWQNSAIGGLATLAHRGPNVEAGQRKFKVFVLSGALRKTLFLLGPSVACGKGMATRTTSHPSSIAFGVNYIQRHQEQQPQEP